jgi:hypothetical protein
MYNLRILRRAIKDVASFPKEYARLISQHIDRLQENPRPPDAKKLRGTTDYSLRAKGWALSGTASYPMQLPAALARLGRAEISKFQAPLLKLSQVSGLRRTVARDAPKLKFQTRRSSSGNRLSSTQDYVMAPIFSSAVRLHMSSIFNIDLHASAALY